MILTLAFGCKKTPEAFEYTISGTVTGKASGHFYFSKTNRIGDEILIPFENHAFEFSGSSQFMFHALILSDYSLQQVFPVLVEPGKIVLELNWDSLNDQSAVVKGNYNKAMHQAQKEFQDKFADIDFDANESRYMVAAWMIENADNFLPVRMLNAWERSEGFLPIEKLSKFISSVKDKNLRNSREFIELYSTYIAKKDNVNALGTKAMNFKLLDAEDMLVDFYKLSAGKFTFVEQSGSWCINSTRNTRNLLPVYERFKDHDLEIITIVPESNKERWSKWINTEQLPWINLVEIDDDLPKQQLAYSRMLFKGGSYLVDNTGMVIANRLTAESLNEILMKLFEPEAYEQHMNEKWGMPENIYILDKEQPVKSFEHLAEIMAGRPFLIDCWATWCSPCFVEFEYNDQLKAFLETLNMAVVYISFDRPEDELKWISTIRNTNLKGYHFRINDSFQDELFEMGFAGSLPTYMIVNEKGEMVVNNAFRPSQTEKLFNQISNALK